MKVLIAYGTTEGQTRKVAEEAANHIESHGHSASLWDSADDRTRLEFDAFDAFILAASVHQEQHQAAIRIVAAAHHPLLNARPSAFISVSLSAVLEETLPEAQRYVARFAELTQWQPALTLLLGGAARFTEYDYFQEQIVKFIVMKRGGISAHEQTGQGSSDQEFTDWDALRGFLDDFLERAEPPPGN